MADSREQVMRRLSEAAALVTDANKVAKLRPNLEKDSEAIESAARALEVAFSAIRSSVKDLAQKVSDSAVCLTKLRAAIRPLASGPEAALSGASSTEPDQRTLQQLHALVGEVSRAADSLLPQMELAPLVQAARDAAGRARYHATATAELGSNVEKLVTRCDKANGKLTSRGSVKDSLVKKFDEPISGVRRVLYVQLPEAERMAEEARSRLLLEASLYVTKSWEAASGRAPKLLNELADKSRAVAAAVSAASSFAGAQAVQPPAPRAQDPRERDLGARLAATPVRRRVRQPSHGTITEPRMAEEDALSVSSDTTTAARSVASDPGPDSPALSDASVVVRRTGMGAQASQTAGVASMFSGCTEHDAAGTVSVPGGQHYAWGTDPLGKGAHGASYVCRDLRTDHRVVIKRSSCSSVLELNHALSEAVLLGRAQSAHVVRLREVFVHVAGPTGSPGRAAARLANLQQRAAAAAITDTSLADAIADTGRLDVCLVMDYYSGGDLEDVLAKARQARQPLARADVVRWLLGASRALAAVHAVGIVHRDVKPANMFLTAEKAPGTGTELVLGDFGVARSLLEVGGRTHSGMGSKAYMAPEVTGTVPYGTPADMWSLGCVLFELLTTLEPGVATNADAPDAPTAGLPGVAEARSRYGAPLVDLLARLLNRHHPESRPTADSVVAELLAADREKPHVAIAAKIPAAKAASSSSSALPGPSGAGTACGRGARTHTEQADKENNSGDHVRSGSPRHARPVVANAHSPQPHSHLVHKVSRVTHSHSPARRDRIHAAHVVAPPAGKKSAH